ENGTYQRDLTRAAERFGATAALTVVGRRRQAMIERGLAKRAERDAKRVEGEQASPPASGRAPMAPASLAPAPVVPAAVANAPTACARVDPPPASASRRAPVRWAPPRPGSRLDPFAATAFTPLELDISPDSGTATTAPRPAVPPPPPAAPPAAAPAPA